MREKLNYIRHYEERYIATPNKPIMKKGLLRWRSHKITLQEIGGKDIFLRSEKKLREAFTKNKKLVFVFNGNELIEESQQYQQGGYISCLLKCYVLPLLEENGSNRESDLFFIATHKDNYKNIEKDMAAAIMSGLSHANEEYRKVANAFRYPFISLMRGNLFCVDARDYEQVNNVFQQIKQTIKK